MRIALLSTMHPLRGGIAQFNASLYRELEKKHEVRAYTFTRQYPGLLFPGQSQYVTESDKADPVPAIEILDSINPFSYAKTAATIRRFNPDLLVMKFWMPFFAPALGFVAGKLRKSGAKVISILDNAIPHERRFGDLLLLRYFLSRNDAFVVMSKIVQDDLLKLKPDAVSVLTPHPVYAHFGQLVDREKARQILEIPKNKHVLLFFGFIRPYKGLDLLIRAMANLSDDYLLLVAGEMYGDFKSYRQIIDETGTASKIKLLIRYNDDEEVALFFSAADVAVLPYKSATQSGSAQIASHFNLPLIVTNVGGLAETVEEGKTGLVVRRLAAGDLAGALQRFFENELSEKFSQAVADASQKYSWEVFVEKLFEVYDRL
jgi:glycosyltransferase involved in cell wall biosynthesis